MYLLGGAANRKETLTSFRAGIPLVRPQEEAAKVGDAVHQLLQ